MILAQMVVIVMSNQLTSDTRERIVSIQNIY